MSSHSLLPSLAILLVTASLGWAQVSGDATEIAPLPVDSSTPATPVRPNTVWYYTGPTNRIWARAEYLLWWMKDSPVPASMVVDATGVTIQELLSGAVFNRPSLIGNDVDGGTRHGARFSLGYWFDPIQTIGVEANYFFLGDQTNGRSATTSPGSALGSPTNVTFSTGGVFIPGSAIYILGGTDESASARVDIESELQGAEFNGIFNLYQGPSFRLSLLGGYRWFQLQEMLTFEATSNRAMFAAAGTQGGALFSAVASNASPTPLTFRDRFVTNNNFNGGQLGARADFTSGIWFGNITGKVALGTMRETIDVTGSNDAFQGFGTFSTGGIYAQPSNIGHHARDRFAVASEVSANVGWQPRSWLRASVGYTFFHVNKVARPGNQTQNTLDITPVFTGSPGQVPSTARLFRESSFWAQGINFSVEFQY